MHDTDMMSRGMPGNAATFDHLHLPGGSDIDIAIFGGMHADYRITTSASGYTVTDAPGNTTVAMMPHIDRMYFADMRLAFDDAALNSASMIGAAFGPDAMGPQLNGIAISLFDQGLTMRQVADIALANMSATGANAEFVDQVYMNVVGHAPDAAEREFYTGMLDHMSRADMLVMAAMSEANAQHIDLVGIAHQGMAFL